MGVKGIIAKAGAAKTELINTINNRDKVLKEEPSRANDLTDFFEEEVKGKKPRLFKRFIGKKRK